MFPLKHKRLGFFCILVPLFHHSDYITVCHIIPWPFPFSRYDYLICDLIQTLRNVA